MKKNRLLSLIAAAALSAGMLAGCGSSTDSSSSAASTGAAAEAVTEAATNAATEAVTEVSTEETAETAEAAAEAATEAAAAADTAFQEEASPDDVTVRVGTLKGPTTMGLVNLMAESDAGTSEGNYEFTMESSPDAITPLVVSGDLDIALVPANLASVLYNKTDGGVSVIDINTEGVLYCVTGDTSIDSFDDLDGKTIVTTGQGATPEYIIDYLMDAYGITADLDFRSEATEVASVLEEDPNTIAILPQPFATVAVIQNENLKEAFALNDAWNDVSEGKSTMIQGVTIVRNDFLEAHQDAVDTFIAEQKESAEKAVSDAEGTAELVASYGIIEKAAIAQQALPKCAIVCTTGEEMKTGLSGFLDILADLNTKSVGGQVPGDDFYYLGE